MSSPQAPASGRGRSGASRCAPPRRRRSRRTAGAGGRCRPSRSSPCPLVLTRSRRGDRSRPRPGKHGSSNPEHRLGVLLDAVAVAVLDLEARYRHLRGDRAGDHPDLVGARIEADVDRHRPSVRRHAHLVLALELAVRPACLVVEAGSRAVARNSDLGVAGVEVAAAVDESDDGSSKVWVPR
jgi:hypothetical protein